MGSANNGGALPPDLSLIVKAREGEAHYVYSILTGFHEKTPAGFKVTEGKAKLTKVQTGIRRSGEVEIVSGVAAGDIVVTDGQIKIQDGMPVSVMQ